MEPLTLGLCILAAGAVLGVWRSRAKRRAQQEKALLPQLHTFFGQEIPIYGRLSPAQQQGFCARAADFLTEQRMFFVDKARGKDPVPLKRVDESLGWRIAAAAATLSLGVENLRWPETRDILVYPTAFDEHYETGSHHKIAGMVHAQGPIIFSATDLVRSYQKEEGYNVALHELAHVLDMADAYADGAIAGSKGAAGNAWSDMVQERVMGIRSGRYAKLRDYAGTNEAELFAVAVEAFFEAPARLQSADSELFERLVRTFHFDPQTLTQV